MNNTGINRNSIMNNTNNNNNNDNLFSNSNVNYGNN